MKTMLFLIEVIWICTVSKLGFW